MNIKTNVKTLIMAVGMFALPPALAVDYSTLSNDELFQIRPGEMTEEERTAFRTEMRERSVSMGELERGRFRG